MTARYLKHLCLVSTHWACGTDGETEDEVLVGGQAVIEGVMMRSPDAYAVAVRRDDGSVARMSRPLAGPGKRWRLFKIPLIRGVGILGQALALGVRALQFSAAEAMGGPEAGAGAPATPGSEEPKPRRASDRWPRLWIGANLILALGFNLVLFVGVPLVATRLLQQRFAFDNFIVFNSIDGILRLLTFVGFIYAVSRMADMRRVFAYHGAEHKTVFAFEAGQPLSVENARGHSRLHPRCGTSFLLVVVGVSIVVFSLFHFETFVAKLASRILLMPLVAGISYELIRFAARHPASLARWVTLPGLMLQRMTTREPDPGQLGIAITALEGALATEGATTHE